MDNHYLVEAKKKVKVDEYEDSYYTHLFISLREHTNCTLWEAVKCIFNELKNKKPQPVVHYKYMFRIDGPNSEQRKIKKRLRFLESLNQPSGNLGHMLWIETIIQTGEVDTKRFLMLKNRIKELLYDSKAG